MGKRIVLKFVGGTAEHGFSVLLQIFADRELLLEQQGELPNATSVLQAYTAWQTAYRDCCPKGRLEKPKAQTTHISIDGVYRVAYEFQFQFNAWLQSQSFHRIREKIIANLRHDEESYLLVQTNDQCLQKLPWQLWDLLEKQYRNTEIALSLINWPESGKNTIEKIVKILAIFGNSQGIDTERDQTLLQGIPNVEIKVLTCPKRQEINDKLWKENFDILFFAGHSSSDFSNKTGQIYINETESFQLEQLSYGLRKAIDRGLKLAIFNSCDGIGLAHAISSLHIPTVIVMRELIPDLVAQQFLKYFLEEFTNYKPFYPSVRKARERLQGLEDRFPCATWLPTVFQNPAQEPISLCLNNKRPRKELHDSSPSPSPVVIIIEKIMKAPPIVYLALLVALGVSPSIWNLVSSDPPDTSSISNGATSTPPSQTPTSPLSSPKISWGDSILIGSSNTKKKCSVAYAAQEYSEAIACFEQALKENRNDPEALIYLNNAKADQSGRTIDIATSIPISGNLQVAEGILRGVAQAQHEIDQRGGINGALLKVTIANDANEPGWAKQIASELINKPLILAVIGHNSSSASIAAAPIYQQAKTVMISPTSTAVEYTNLGDYIFRTVLSARADAQVLAEYGVEVLRNKKFAICSDSTSPFSQSLGQEFKSFVESAGQSISNVPCDMSSSAFNPGVFVAAATADNVDAVLMASSVKMVPRAISVLNASQGRFNLLGGRSMYNSKIVEKAQQNANGMVVTVPWHPQATPNTEFPVKAEQLWGGPVNWRSVAAYDAVLVIAAALEKQDGHPSREQIHTALSDPSFAINGASGRVRFTPEGDRESDSAIGVLVQVQPDPGSNWGYSFVSLP
ncbi:MAG: ABC transporter substrate-binding protein [Xenococcaceae cyanobacterium]